MEWGVRPSEIPYGPEGLTLIQCERLGHARFIQHIYFQPSQGGP